MKPKVSDSNESLPKPVLLYSDWWFGTFSIFPYIGNVIIPSDFHIIFRRGRSTTNQVLLYIHMHMADEFVANDDHQHHQGTTGLGAPFKAP